MKSSITKRSDNFSKWFLDLLKAADLCEHSPTKGCITIKPTGYSIWQKIKTTLDKIISDHGYESLYFPLLIPLELLQKEANHIDGFAKECAVVTHTKLAQNSQGQLIPHSQLEHPYVIRPTSEAIIGEAFSRWIQSHKQLPYKINQWANIMRWEMRTRAFLRTSEFLWHEGHAAFQSKEHALFDAQHMCLEYYKFLKDFLAIACIVGEKTPGERFPGASNTYTLEAMMQNKMALQSATSHFLDRHFAKAYNIKFQSYDKSDFVYTSSFGLSTRIIGALIMTHGDDYGMILPPKISPIKIYLIPLLKKPNKIKSKDINQLDLRVIKRSKEIAKALKKVSYCQQNISVKIDLRANSNSEKKWDAIKKGYPILIEIGKKELESQKLTIKTRWNMQSSSDTNHESDNSSANSSNQADQSSTLVYSLKELVDSIEKILDEGQRYLYEKSQTLLTSNTQCMDDFDKLKEYFLNCENPGFVLSAVNTKIDHKAKLTELKITERCTLKQNSEVFDHLNEKNYNDYHLYEDYHDYLTKDDLRQNIQGQKNSLLLNNKLKKEFNLKKKKCIFSNTAATDWVVLAKAY